MNIIVSILFDDKTNDLIMQQMSKLKNTSRKGRFIKKRNVRLNLIKLEDVDDIRPIVKYLEGISLSELNITLDCLEKSRRDSGDTYWLRATQNDEIDNMRRELKKIADDFGYEYERKKYKPRVKLGSLIIARPDYAGEHINAVIESISMLEVIPKHYRKEYNEIYRKTAK